MTCTCTDRYGFVKRLYATEAEALKHIRQDGIAPYRCPEGQGWHLTHAASSSRDASLLEIEMDNTIEVFEAYMLEHDDKRSDQPSAKHSEKSSTQEHTDKRQQLSRAYRSMIDRKR